MEKERPVWQHNCELCCACLHFCLVEAILLNTMQGTKGDGTGILVFSVEDMQA